MFIPFLVQPDVMPLEATAWRGLSSLSLPLPSQMQVSRTGPGLGATESSAGSLSEGSDHPLCRPVSRVAFRGTQLGKRAAGGAHHIQ